MKKIYLLFGFLSISINAQITQGAGVTDASGNAYETVIIGNLEWMKGNLRTTKKCGGTTIPQGNGVTWGTNASMYMQSNNTAINAVYRGLLYNWLATQGTQSACPCGWRVPTNADWNNLKDYLITNGYNYDGSTTDNKIAKSLAYNFWWETSSAVGAVGNNLDLNNSSTFSAHPAGSITNNGNYGLLNQAHWWSSTANSYDYFWLSFSGSSLMSGTSTNLESRYYGRSIRCVKNATLSNSQFDKSDIKVFPNPVQNQLNIDSPEEVLSIEIFDLLGKKIFESKTKTIDVSELQNGIYLLKINTNQGSYIQKFIKQ